MNNVVGFAEKQEWGMWLEICLIGQNTYMQATLHLHSKYTMDR